MLIIIDLRCTFSRERCLFFGSDELMQVVVSPVFPLFRRWPESRSGPLGLVYPFIGWGFLGSLGSGRWFLACVGIHTFTNLNVSLAFWINSWS